MPRQGMLVILSCYTSAALLLLCASSAVLADAVLLPGQTDYPQTRIIGGVPTRIAQVPATVALLKSARVELDGNLFQAQFCGGTVIADRWVLTAAHCVVDLQGNITDADSLLVLTGSADLHDPVNQPIPVIQVIAHPEYQRVEQGRDIALLQLAYDALVQPIPINELPVGTDDSAFIAGWGAVDIREDGRTQSFPNELRGTFVNMTPGATCGTAFPDYRGYTDDTNICAGVVEGGKDSCQGDSGGPLYRVDPVENRAIAIAGITSWGVSCGVAENPGVYTNVASFLEWIKGNLIRFTVQEPGQAQPANAGLVNTSSSEALPLVISQQPAPSNDGAAPDVDESGDTLFSGAFLHGLLALLVVATERTLRLRLLRS